MKAFVLFSLLASNLASASILAPLLECKSSDPQVTFTLDNRTSGSISSKSKTCRFSVVSFDEKKREAGGYGYDIVFGLDNCHPETFLSKGFLRISSKKNDSQNVSGHILALKNHQGLPCATTLKSVQQTFKKI